MTRTEKGDKFMLELFFREGTDWLTRKEKGDKFMLELFF